MNRKLFFIVFCLIIADNSFSQNNYSKIFITKDIGIIRISGNAYVHVSYDNIPSFGRVASNGLIFTDNGRAYLFDTPVSDSLTQILVDWIEDTLKCRIAAFVPNHWHSDCMGGLAYLQSLGIKSYANDKTVKIAVSKKLPVPAFGFKDSLILNKTSKKIICYYLGAAHADDNIVVWIPSERILFPGCMVKGIESSGLGNTADGDLSEYPETLRKIINKFKNIKYVIPGHGNVGGTELLDRTLKLCPVD